MNLSQHDRTRVSIGGGVALPVFCGLGFALVPSRFQGAFRALPDQVEGVGFVLALAVNAWLTVKLLRKVVNSRSNVLAPVYFGTAVFLLVFIFSLSYWFLGDSDGSCLDHRVTKVDSIYFTLTTLSTTGFGDLSPVTQSCRAMVALQMVYGFVVVSGFFGVFLTRFAGRGDDRT